LTRQGSVKYNDGLTGWQRYKSRYPERVLANSRAQYY